MTFTDPYQQSYPPSLWGVEPELRAPAAPAYELPADIEHFTIDAVKEWVGDDAERAQVALEAEEARGDDARVTLVDWLHGHGAEEEAKN